MHCDASTVPLFFVVEKIALRIFFVVILNGWLAVTLSFLSISLIEIKAHPHYSERLQKMTPACSDPAMVCPAGNGNIDTQSAQWSPLKSAQGRQDDSTQSLQAATDTMQPFSYIIASDAQRTGSMAN
jgi:hypothetical protein